VSEQGPLSRFVCTGAYGGKGVARRVY